MESFSYCRPAERNTDLTDFLYHCHASVAAPELDTQRAPWQKFPSTECKRLMVEIEEMTYADK